MVADLAFEELRPTRTELGIGRRRVASRRDFKRRKRRARQEEVAISLAMVESATRGGARSRRFIPAFIFINLSLIAALRVASANEIIPTEFVSSDSPEAQPLVYNLLMGEFGSGDGSFAGAGRVGAKQRLELSSSSAPSSSVSPSLIEARCWNNYENDNDCKQLNVITAPNSDELLRRKQQQQQQSSDQFGVDNLITPVVIFEAASTVEPEPEAQPDERHGLFTGQPPYQTSGQRRPNDQFASPPQTATIVPVQFEGPITRPSVKNSVIYVATPQPKNRPGTHIKTTTVGRKCRDEDDADCDEPDDESRDQKEIKSDSSDDRPKDRNSNSINSGPASSTTGGSFESGSGGFAPTDDNDDSTDDGDGDDDEDDDNSNGASNTIDESSGSLPPQPHESTRHHLEVTSVYEGSSESGSDAEDRAQSSMQSTSTSTEFPSSTRQQTGAEIEVVVHSTLPPSFPISTKVAFEQSSTSSSTTAALTTQPPDEVFTSRPIFPPSTEPAANSIPDNAAGEGGDEAASNNRELSTTTELDLYTFKPIPIPVEQSPARYGQRQQHQYGSSSAGGGEQHEVSSQNIFKRPPIYETGRNTFDDGWTTRRPLNQQSQFGERSQTSQFQPPDPLASSNQKRVGAAKGHIGTDMLPTLLLYASIIVLVTTALIFAVMVYIFWRRNTIRRQNLMQKARLLNGAQPAHASHLAHSFSHAAQMHGGAAPPASQAQGLLSTYAPGKGISMGQVTTSVAKQSDLSRQHHFEDEEDESGRDTNGRAERVFHKNNSKDHLMEGDDEGSTENQPETCRNNVQTRAPRLDNTSGHLNQQSWSTDEPTTSSGGGGGGGGTANNSNSRIQDTQQAQRQLQHSTHLLNGQSRTPNYPNSLSDGRQNSSSISDSQCSPDASIERAPPMQASGAPQSRNQASTPQSDVINSRQQMMQSPRMVGPAFGPQQMLLRPGGAYPNMANGRGSPLFRPVYGPHMMMAPNGFALPIKNRPTTASRSIEDLQLSASSSHVGFVNQPPTQQQVPFGLQGPQMGQPGVVAHLMRGAGAQNQMFSSPQHQAYPVALGMEAASSQPIISPQRILMNPLATLSRRYPPGAGLNRNIYSEDSSSFMTTSPSLARTSSSSSFAFNLAKHQPSESPPSVASFNSIKAKPIVDPTTGRVINDYTMQAQFDGHDSNGDAAITGPPPVFGRRDRSEAWYV